MIDQKKEPLVSIIIPCYNYAHFLLECFENLKQQSYFNWECIVIDNASTDHTKKVVEEAIKSDGRFTYLNQPIKGPSAARNMGIKEAKGEYIQFLDADDLIQINKFKNALALFESNLDADVVYSDMRYFDNDNKNIFYYEMKLNKINDKPWMSYAQGKKEEMLPKLLMGNIMVISSPLIKKSILKDIGYFDESYFFHEDWEFWLRLAFRDKKFIVDMAIDSQTLIRVHKTSQSINNSFKMYLGTLKITLKYRPQLDNILLINKVLKIQNSAILSLEKILFKEKENLLFLKESLSLLFNILPYKKYKLLLNCIDKQKFNNLKFKISVNYIYSFLKYKFKNV